MRRLVAVLIMLIVPLQSAWSAVSSLHVPLGNSVATGVMHTHEHVHPVHGSHDISPADIPDGHGEDGHHNSHCHPVFNSILTESSLILGVAPNDGPILQAPTSFFSHTPPLFDRPPLVLA